MEEHPDNKPGKKGQRFRFAELSPETLNIRADEYAKQVSVDSWAQERGWQLLGEGHVLREENTMTGQPKDRPLGRSGLTDSPNSEFGRSSKPADEFGTGPGSGDIVFSGSKTGAPSDQNGGALPKVEPPFVEVGSCASCQAQAPLRADRHHQFLVCQACFDYNNSPVDPPEEHQA